MKTTAPILSSEADQMKSFTKKSRAYHGGPLGALAPRVTKGVPKKKKKKEREREKKKEEKQGKKKGVKKEKDRKVNQYRAIYADVTFGLPPFWR